MPIFPSFFVNKTGGYEIEQSLRFDGSSYLEWTPGSGANRDAWTISCWVKRARNGVEEDVISHDGSNQLSFDLGGDFVDFEQYYAKYQDYKVTSAGKYRDPSAWYHFVIVWDSLNSTTDDRKRLYINGKRIPNSSTNSPSSGYNDDVPSGKDSVFFDSASPFYIGGTSGRRFQGYIAEVHGVNGSALDATSFGEYDNNNVWRPINYSGSYGTNGFYLKFDPSATNGIGHDHSGNGNNWTANSFTTSGTGTDVMNDTPTNNYATFNPNNTTAVASSATTLDNGNLDVAFNTSANNYSSYLTHGIASGKYYFEVTCTSSTTSASNVGFVGDNNLEAKRNATASAVPGQHGTYGRGVDGTGTLYNGSGSSDGSYMAAWSQNDVIMVAIDADNGKFWLGANGNWADGSGNTDESGLIAAAEISLSGSTTPYLFGVGDSSGSVAASFTLNAGQRAFSHTPPTGYSALNTSNLPAPDIADGSDYFNTVLYTGDNLEQAITGVGFQPDWVWVKCRNQGSTNHVLQDAVRGAQKYITSDTNVVEGTSNGTIISFDSDGFTIGAGNPAVPVNNNGDTFVAWNWLGANGTSSNTAGSITSTVSANPTAGFSIVTYTSPNDTADQTVGHGLGVKPSLILVKNRDNTYNWDVYHSSLGYNASLILSSSNSTRSGAFGAEPTSTVFTTKTSYTHNGTQKYVAYCFAEVEGYSKFGSYTGNGNANGPFVFCGFKPRWIMLKKTNTSTIYTSWSIYDTARDSYNVSDAPLYANVSDQEGTNSQGTVESGHNVDILSNGFKLRDSNQIRNTSGDTYIFAAFAENPFGGSGVSPATAR